MYTKFAAVAIAALLTACGGGGSGQNYGVAPATPVTVATPETPIAVTSTPQAVTAAPDKTGCHVVIYGDSILNDGAPWLKEYPSAIMRRLRPTWTVDDRAVAGQTGLTGATTYVNDPRPQGAIVVVGWGMNDLIQGDIFTASLDTFLKKIKAEKSVAVVTGIVQHPLIPVYGTYNVALREAATANGAAYADFGSVPITTVDQIHPDQPSMDLLIEDLVNTIDKECQ